MGQILLVRHGQASFASSDYDWLSDIGKDQARQLGRWLHHCQTPIHHVATGTMRRHRQTAECAAEAMTAAGRSEALPTPRHDEAFNEFDHVEIMHRHRPDLSEPGATKALFDASESPSRTLRHLFSGAMMRWMEGNADHDYQESWPQFSARCIAGLTMLANTVADAETAVLFTSGGFISAVCGNSLGLSVRAIFELNWSLANSGVTSFSCHAGRVRLTGLNSVAHLEWNRTPEMITYR